VVDRAPRPFPWQSLPRVDARTASVASAAAAWGMRATRAEVPTPAGPVRVRGGTAALLAGASLASALADPTSAVAIVRARGRLAPAAYVIAGGALVRGLARLLLGGPDELDAPRPPTPAERGVLAYAVAAAIARAELRDVLAEPSDLAGPLLAASLGEAAVVELEADGACTGWGAVAVPIELIASAPPAPRGLPRAAWLDEPAIAGVLAIGALRAPRAEIAALAPRDVIVLEPSVSLRVARGAIAGALAPARDGFIVSGPYARGPMQEMLGEDASVELVACAGAVILSVRRVLELAPGQVVSLGRPVGGAVELRVGAQLVARGELVDVDGELGVRVLSVEGGRAPG
jgi:hypothetical protein